MTDDPTGTAHTEARAKQARARASWQPPRWWLIGAVVLPLVPVIFGIARGQWLRETGTLWVFDIQGYDPRDLLRGHYLQYTLVLDRLPTDGDCTQGEVCCYCLARTADDAPPTVNETSCAEASRCDGHVEKSALDSLRRYYVPEAEAARAEELLRQHAAHGSARLLVAIDDDAAPHVVDLLLDGRSLADALRE